MGKKGFTLAELLGVIIILGSLIVVVVTPIISNINKNKEKLDSAAIELLYNTCESYIDNNKNNYEKINDNIYYITVGSLINSGLMEKEYLNAYSNTVLSEYSVIKVTVENGSYKYQLINNNTYNNIYDSSLNISNNTYSYMNGNYFKENLNNNYVLYSGMVWRIVGINKDKTIKLLLDEDATALIPGKTNDNYKKSFARNWLNNNFYDLLSNNDIIKSEDWCVDDTDNILDKKDSCNNSIKDKVGLLTVFENNNALDQNTYKNGSNYITMTQKKDTPGFYYQINSEGNIAEFGQGNNITYIRPVINILPYTSIIKGTGSKTDPYVLNKDYSINNNSKRLIDIDLPTGTYVNFNNNKYRIMKKENDNIEMILADYMGTMDDTFSYNNDRFNLSSGVGYKLNTYSINYYAPKNIELLQNDCIYNGDYYAQGSNFENTSLINKYPVYGAYIGMPKAGDIFAGPIGVDKTVRFWLQTEYSAEEAYMSGTIYPSAVPKSKDSYNLRGVIYITGEAIVTSGNGTIDNPLMIGG